MYINVNKKLCSMVVLIAIILLNGTACTNSAETSAGFDAQEPCPVCGEILKPDSLGKEGCYRTVDGIYITKEEYARNNMSNPNKPELPLPETCKRTCCPDCGETLKPGTFGKEGCYRTKSGYYLTKEQFVRLRLGLDICQIDEDTEYALIGYDGADLCGSYVVAGDSAGFIYTDDYVHTEPLSEKMTAEKAKQIAEDEKMHQNYRRSGGGSNTYAYYQIHRIYYDKQADMWLVDYYIDGDAGVAYDYLQVFIDGKGVTKEIYCPAIEDTFVDIIPNENVKKDQITETGEFSYGDIHKSSDFVHKKEQQDVSRETLVSYALDEIKNSAFASYLEKEPVIKLAPTNQEGTAFRVSFYWEQASLPVIHIYINKNGETTDMFVHEW